MKLLMILIVLVLSTPQTVIYEFDANPNLNDGWVVRDNDCFFNNCGGIKYFGQPINNDNSILISRLFSNLKGHSHIQVEARVLRISTSDPFNIYLDYIEAQQSHTSSSSSCAGSQVLTIATTLFKHNRRTLWITAQFFNAGGLMSLKISMINCQYDCLGCIENYKIFCLSWKLHQYSFGEQLITNSDGWIFALTFSSDFNCGGCNYLYFSEINYSTQLPNHQDVLIKFYKVNAIIIVDYVYDKKTISADCQQVEILIENHLDPILLLKIKSQTIADHGEIRDFEVYQTQPKTEIILNEGCLELIDTRCLICKEGWIYDEFLENCHPICGDQGQLCHIRNFEVSYTQPKITINKFNEGCLEQIETTCLICKEGWIQDQFFENCRPICGDGVIQGQEKCNDANLISNDSCYQCEYSCINFCKTCEFGICFECIFGYDLNADFNCVPLCGDGNVIPYSAEQCDLTDDGKWDNCQDCLYILIADCKHQLLSMCLECEVGFQLLENACFPHCGDKFILQQYEECDDGNLQPYDGCFQCKFQCSEDCNICDKGQCILKCEDGYKFVNNNCLSVCGDQIVTKEEDCDDGNTIQFDGCFDCKYSYFCPENCYDCYQGTCLECNDQYQLLHSNQCKLQLNCGDGQLQKQEECDDGNYEALDGCKDCLIEQNWICATMIRESPSQCVFARPPKLVITYLNITQNKQYISIQFNQQVKIYTTQPLSERINFQLSNVNKKNWNSSLYIIQNVGSYVSFGEYVIEIIVHQLLEFRPILTILVNQTVANIDDVVMDDIRKSITLQYPQYLDEIKKDYSYNLKRLNVYFIYGLSGFACGNLVLGSGDLFIEILAILQFQQYLKYINLQFPENLEIYFSIYNPNSFSQIFQFIQLQQNQQPFLEGKFDVYKYDPNLIVNLSSQILQGLLFLFLILMCQLMKKVIYNWIFCSRNFYYASQLSQYMNPKIIAKFQVFFYNFCLYLVNLKKIMSFKGIQKALLLNGWDMIFKTLLYARNFQTNNFLNIVQLIIASIILLLYFTLLLGIFKDETQKISRYERFEMHSFGRQFFFLLFLINIQRSQIFQIGVLLLTSIFQIRLLFNYRKVQNKNNYIVQMVVEISVLTFIFSSFLYIQDFDEYFHQEKKIILGWIHIIILSCRINCDHQRYILKIEKDILKEKAIICKKSIICMNITI